MQSKTGSREYYCGIDLHARTMYLCIRDWEGTKVLHRNANSNPDELLAALYPYRESVVVAAECMFTWYWLADTCEDVGIPFVLEHTLYMKAINGGKVKNDRVDAHKTAVLLGAGCRPWLLRLSKSDAGHTGPASAADPHSAKEVRAVAHIKGTNAQYNLPDIGTNITFPRNREGLAERFEDASVRKSIETDLAHKLARAMYFMLRREQVFDLDRFVAC